MFDVIVTNHGGRHLDSAMAPIDILSAVADAVGSIWTVRVDSGFRRGADIVKVLARGAKDVMIGRPMLYGAAVAGLAGAARAIATFR